MHTIHKKFKMANWQCSNKSRVSNTSRGQKWNVLIEARASIRSFTVYKYQYSNILGCEVTLSRETYNWENGKDFHGETPQRNSHQHLKKIADQERMRTFDYKENNCSLSVVELQISYQQWCLGSVPFVVQQHRFYWQNAFCNKRYEMLSQRNHATLHIIWAIQVNSVQRLLCEIVTTVSLPVAVMVKCCKWCPILTGVFRNLKRGRGYTFQVHIFKNVKNFSVISKIQF